MFHTDKPRLAHAAAARTRTRRLVRWTSSYRQRHTVTVRLVTYSYPEFRGPHTLLGPPKSWPTRLLPIGSTFINRPPSFRCTTSTCPVVQLTSAAAMPHRRAAPVIALSPKEAERRDSKLSFPFARRMVWYAPHPGSESCAAALSRRAPLLQRDVFITK